MGKKALVVSGGGSKGAYAVGVLKLLSEMRPELEFDILVGTSTGSLIVPMIASDNLPLLEQVYTSVRKHDIVTEGNLVENFRFAVSFYDTQPLANLIMQHFTDSVYNKIKADGKELFLATTCLQTGATVMWGVQAPITGSDYAIEQIRDAGEFRRAILASCNQPVFMEPITIRQGMTEPRQYVDGGVREYLGIQLAIDAGADEIFAISLAASKEEPVDTAYTKIYPILERTIDIFTEDVGWNDIKVPRVYNTALRYVDAVKRKMKDDGISEEKIEEYFRQPFFPTFSNRKPLRIHHIAPEQPLGGGPGGLNFNPDEMTAMLNRGIRQMQTYLAGLPGAPDGNV